MGGTYVFDIETDGLLDKGTKIHCLVAIDVASREVHRFCPDDIQRGLDLLENADKLIAHNGINFDIPFIKKIRSSFKVPELYDTLVMSRVLFADLRDIDFQKQQKSKDYPLPQKLYGSHGLKAWGYRMDEHKGEFGEQTDWSTFSDEMLDYCEQDCWVTLSLLELLNKQDYSKKCIELEHNFATIIQRQVQNGWAFDEKAGAALYAQLVQKRQELHIKLTELFPGWWEDMKTPKEYLAGPYKAKTKTELTKLLRDKGRNDLIKEIAPGELRKKHTPFNPASGHHIYRAFSEKYNWKPKLYTDKGHVKTDESVLKTLKYPEAADLCEYALLKKTIGQLAEGALGWLKLVKNGHIYGDINTNGAVTGRCTHSRPNVAQVPSVSRDKKTGEILTGIQGGFGFECRSLFIAKPGMVLVGADASGLELRCLAHYMSHWDKGTYVKTLLSGDIHTANQRAAGLPTRDNAKTFIYAFLYGAGDTKIGSIVHAGRKAGKTLKARFLKTLPALNDLVDLVKATASRGWVRGLDGRRVVVRSEHAALNTLLQSAGAIIMKFALVEADRLLQDQGYIPGKHYEFVGNIHDEIQTECLPDIAESVGQTVVQAIRNATDYFNFQCPLDGEYKIGQSWAQTH